MTTVAFAEVPTPVGPFVLAVTEDGLVASGWGSPATLRERLGFPEAADPGRTTSVVAQLNAYFAGESRSFATPIDWRLTAGSRRKVLQALYEIPYGKVVTYGELAARSGTGVPARGLSK